MVADLLTFHHLVEAVLVLAGVALCVWIIKAVR